MPDRRISRDSREAVGASTLEPDAKIGERRGSTLSLVSFDQAKKSLANRLRHHRGFRAAALLLEHHQGLVELGIALTDVVAHERDLWMLAAQTQDSRPRNIGMMNVAGDQTAKVRGIVVTST